MGIGKATARAAVVGAVLAGALAPAAQAADRSLWKVYDRVLSKARYIDMTHRITPDIPVWKGFGPGTFSPSINPDDGPAYTYANDGFEATAYQLATDQFGTQLDPPAHWDPNYPAHRRAAADLRGPPARRDLDRPSRSSRTRSTRCRCPT